MLVALNCIVPKSTEAVADDGVAIEVLERSDVAVEVTSVKDDGITVNESETTMILKVDCVDAGVGQYWPYSISCPGCRDSL